MDAYLNAFRKLQEHIRNESQKALERGDYKIAEAMQDIRLEAVCIEMQCAADAVTEQAAIVGSPR